ncbi:hypothetical protein BYT27DRAFT_7191251 [Phlegmacium glaucopus]|nr:hypothetical protein BYT27DRAFT_7191251 [Phlegmacium glaucopus]
MTRYTGRPPKSTGNAFFEWLADQLHHWSIPNPNLEQNKIEITMRTALRDVALEKDEVLILSHESLSCDSPNDISDSDYLPLSRLNRLHETELLKRETDLLSTRLVLTKKASQKLTQAIKSLQRTLERWNQTQVILKKGSELSVNVRDLLLLTVT